MSKRGAYMSSQAWDKVVLHWVDLSRYDFGLGENDFSEVRYVIEYRAHQELCLIIASYSGQRISSIMHGL